MSIILNVINEKSWNRELVESLDVSTDRSIHKEKLGQRGLFIDRIKNGCSSLRVAQHREIWVVSEIGQDLFEHLQRESFNSLFTSLGSAIARTIDGNNEELLQIANSDKVLVKHVNILVWRVLGSWPMHNDNQRLARFSDNLREDVSERCFDVGLLDRFKLFSKEDLLFLVHSCGFCLFMVWGENIIRSYLLFKSDKEFWWKIICIMKGSRGRKWEQDPNSFKEY